MKKRNYTKLLLLKCTQYAKFSLAVLFIALANIQMYAHTVQAAWGFSPNGDLRIYLEHWHGDFSHSPHGSTIDLTVSVNGGTAITSTLTADGVINNTTINNLPHASGSSIQVLGGCSGSANTYNDWAYWDTPIPPSLCPDGGTITVTVSNPNDVNFEDCGGLFPATASSFVSDCPCVITCPGDQQINLGANCQVALPDYTSMGVPSEDCAMVSMVTQSPAPGTMIMGETDVMVTLTAIDGGANPTCTFTVSTNDVTAPTAVCADVIVDIQANEMTSVTASQIAGGSSDACSAVSLNISAGTTSYNCDDNGMSFPVTVVVTDASGNSTSCTGNVTVADPNSYCCAPADAICANTTVYLDANGNASIVSPDVDGGSTYECGLQSMMVSPNSFTCADLGSNNPVTLTVTDVNGDSDICTAMVTVVDNLSPNPVCLNPTVYLESDGTYTLQDADILDFVNTTDNCNFFVSDISPAVVDCDDFDTVVPVTVTVSDDSGNTAQCTAMVEVQKGTDLPEEWGHSNVGNAIGGAVYDPCEELFCIESNGVSNPLLDKCYVAFQQICGSNMEITARVVSVGPNHGFGGIMIRDAMDGGSKKIAMKTQLSNTHFVQRDTRTTTNGLAQTRQIFRPGSTWLRIIRNGNQFLCYTSYDGSYWRFADYLVINMSDCVYIGLFSEGVHGSVLTTSCFDNVSISGGILPPLVENGNDWEAESSRAIDFAVFPNPAINEVNIDLSQFEENTFTMKVFNNVGQLIFRKEYLYIEDYLEKLDVSQYSNGIYLINIELENGTVLNKKLVVNK